MRPEQLPVEQMWNLYAAFYYPTDTFHYNLCLTVVLACTLKAHLCYVYFMCTHVPDNIGKCKHKCKKRRYYIIHKNVTDLYLSEFMILLFVLISSVISGVLCHLGSVLYAVTVLAMSKDIV
jgi:hypothetical protein